MIAVKNGSSGGDAMLLMQCEGEKGGRGRGRERGRRGDNNPLKGMGEGREGEYRKGGNYLGFLEDRRITSTTGRRTEGGGAGRG